MKKNLKKIVSLVLVLAMTLAISVPAFAASNNPDTRSQIKKLQSAENEITAPSKTYIEYISNYFKNHKAYKVIDKEQNDINEAFYQNNLENYLASDFLTIKINDWKNVDYFCKETVVKEPNVSTAKNQDITPYSSTQRMYVTHEYKHLLEEPVVGHRIEVHDTITGSFVYNVNTGKILEYTAPTLKVLYDGVGQAWTIRKKNVSTGARLSSDKYTITFNAGFDVVATVQLDKTTVDTDFGHVYDELEASGE